MADNVSFSTSIATPPSTTIVAADDVDGVSYQRMKLVIGSSGEANNDISIQSPLPMTMDLGNKILKEFAEEKENKRKEKEQ